MNQELDDECSLSPHAHFDEDPDVEVEYLSKGEAAVIYIVIGIVSWLFVWGVWRLLKMIWHAVVWAVTR